MPTMCWIAPEMLAPDRAWSDGLAGGADLAVHGEPSVVADGREAASSPPSASASCLARSMFFVL